MLATIIIAVVLFVLYLFLKALGRNNKELKETSTPTKFSELVTQLNAYAFGLEGKVTVINKNTFNLYQDGKNQIINFHYSTGVLTITWKYKWYQNEIAHKKDYSDLQNIGINQQVQIANDMIKEMDVVIARHKQKVNASLNHEDTLDHILKRPSNNEEQIDSFMELGNYLNKYILPRILLKNANNGNQIVDLLIDKMADSYEEDYDDNSVTYNYTLISKKLLEGVVSISKTAVAGFKSHQDEELVLCECIMIISSIAIRQVLIKIDNDDKTAMLISEYKQFVYNYFKDNHSELFEDDFTFNKFVDNRFLIYTKEIYYYSVDKEFEFPKATHSIYISPMDEKVENHFGVENMEINLCIPIWMKALDVPIDILLLLR